MGYDPIEDVELKDVTENELRAKGVMSLATRPNAPSRYGEGGLTAEDLKEKFDSLARALADRINTIHKYLLADDLAENIKVDINADGESGIPTLAALADAIESGVAAKYFTVEVGANGYKSLQEAIFGILKDVATNAKNIDETVYRADINTIAHDAALELVFTFFDKNDKEISSSSVFVQNAEYYVYNHNNQSVSDGVHPYLVGLIQSNGMHIQSIDEDVDTVEARVEILDKKVENLRAALSPEYFTTDSAVAHIKPVPADALPFAEVQEVGGMSYSVGNLFDAEHVENHFGGAKENIVVENGGAKITITGDPDGSYNSVNLKFEAGVTYCATFGGNGKLYYVPAPAALTEIKSGVPFTPPTSTYYDINCLAFGPDGGTYTDLMIVMGDKPAEYMPYGQSTLKNAAVTALEILGTNRLDMSGLLNECLRDNGDGTYTFTKVSNDDRFTGMVPLFAPVGQQLYNTFEVIYTNIPNFGNKLPLQMLDASGKKEVSSVAIVDGDGGWYTAGGGSVYVRSYLEASYPIGTYITFKNPMVQFAEYYKAPLAPYAPYRKYAINIPDEVQSLQGYGQGNPTGTEYNYIDYTRRVFVQKGYRDDNGAWIPTGREIDISAYLPEDNLIEVEGNGSITFVNAENLHVPSKIEYQLKEATA